MDFEWSMSRSTTFNLEQCGAICVDASQRGTHTRCAHLGRFLPRLRAARSTGGLFFGSISNRRAYTLSFVSYSSRVAPAQKPNGTGPNHVITGSGPIAAITLPVRADRRGRRSTVVNSALGRGAVCPGAWEVAVEGVPVNPEAPGDLGHADRAGGQQGTARLDVGLG